MAPISDFQKIGIGLAGFGISFLFLGVLMFFDRGLLAIGNILFISGLILVVGLERAYRFFFQSHKLKATAFFFGGIAVVLIGWPVIGMIIEIYGFILLFGGFLPVAVNFLRRVPILSMFMNFPGISYIYTDWVNQYLSKKDENCGLITSLQVDLCNGVRLACVIEAVFSCKVPNIVKEAKDLHSKIQNIETCIQYLSQKGVDIKNVPSEGIHRGRLSNILNLIYNIYEFKTKEEIQQDVSMHSHDLSRAVFDQKFNYSNCYTLVNIPPKEKQGAFETEMKSSDERGGGISILTGGARRASSSSACHSLDRPNRAGGRNTGLTNTTAFIHPLADGLRLSEMFHANDCNCLPRPRERSLPRTIPLVNEISKNVNNLGGFSQLDMNSNENDEHYTMKPSMSSTTTASGKSKLAKPKTFGNKDCNEQKKNAVDNKDSASAPRVLASSGSRVSLPGFSGQPSIGRTSTNQNDNDSPSHSNHSSRLQEPGKRIGSGIKPPTVQHRDETRTESSGGKRRVSYSGGPAMPGRTIPDCGSALPCAIGNRRSSENNFHDGPLLMESKISQLPVTRKASKVPANSASTKGRFQKNLTGVVMMSASAGSSSHSLDSIGSDREMKTSQEANNRSRSSSKQKSGSTDRLASPNRSKTANAMRALMSDATVSTHIASPALVFPSPVPNQAASPMKEKSNQKSSGLPTSKLLPVGHQRKKIQCENNVAANEASKSDKNKNEVSNEKLQKAESNLSKMPKFSKNTKLPASSRLPSASSEAKSDLKMQSEDEERVEEDCNNNENSACDDTQVNNREMNGNSECGSKSRCENMSENSLDYSVDNQKAACNNKLDGSNQTEFVSNIGTTQPKSCISDIPILEFSLTNEKKSEKCQTSSSDAIVPDDIFSQTVALSAFDIKPMQPITHFSIGITSAFSKYSQRLKKLSPSRRHLFPSNYLTQTPQRPTLGSSDSLNVDHYDTEEAGYMSDGDFLSSTSRDARSSGYISDGGISLCSKMFGHKDKKTNYLDGDDDSIDGYSSLSGEEAGDRMSLDAGSVDIRAGFMASMTKNQSTDQTSTDGSFDRGILSRNTLPVRGKKAILPIAGFVQKHQSALSSENKSRSREEINFDQCSLGANTSGVYEGQEMLKQSPFHGLFSGKNDRSMKEGRLDDCNMSVPVVFNVGSSDVRSRADHPSYCTLQRPTKNSETKNLEAAELSNGNDFESFCQKMMSNSSSNGPPEDRRYYSLGRHHFARNPGSLSFENNPSKSISINNDGGQSLCAGTSLSNPHALYRQSDISRRTSIKSKTSSIDEEINWEEGGIVKYDSNGQPNSHTADSLSHDSCLKRRSDDSLWLKHDGSLDIDNASTVSHPTLKYRSTSGLSALKTMASGSLSRPGSVTPLSCGHNLAIAPSSSSISGSEHSPLPGTPKSCMPHSPSNSIINPAANYTLHGSSLSLGSCSSSYSAAPTEEFHAQEIRKLRHELETAHSKVSSLNMQLNINEHVVNAFEQSLSNMTQKLHQLSMITNEKDSALKDMRAEIELLRQKAFKSPESKMVPSASMDQTLNSNDSLTSDANSSDAEKKKRQKKWMMSFGKAFSRKKNKLGQNQESEHEMVISHPLDFNIESSLVEAPSKKDPIYQLEQKLHEREMKLTDVQLEALTSAHQLESMRDTMNQMKNEMQYLKADNERLQQLMISRESKSPSPDSLLSTRPKDLDNRMSFDYPTSPDIIPKEREVKSSSKVLLSVQLKHTIPGESQSSPSQVKSTEILIGQMPVLKSTNWEMLYSSVSKVFEDYLLRIDPEESLGLNAGSIKCLHIGDLTWKKDERQPEAPPSGYLVGFNTCISLTLKGAEEDSSDSLAFETMIPKSVVERYVSMLCDYRRIILCGPSGTGKTYLAQKLAEYMANRSSKSEKSNSVSIFNVDHKSSKELRQYLSNIAEQCETIISDLPSVIILDNLHHVVSLGEVFNGFLSIKNQASPYVIGTMNQTTPSTANLQLHHNFRWILYSNHIEPVNGFLGRFLRRQLIEKQILNDQDEVSELSEMIEWIPQVVRHVNRFLEAHNSSDVTIGPQLFLSCPMGRSLLKVWFTDLWNYSILPYTLEAVREGIQTYGCRSSWEDPTELVVKTCPWNKNQEETIRSLNLLRLRPEDVGYDCQTSMSGSAVVKPTTNQTPQGSNMSADPLLNMLLKLQEAANYQNLVNTDSDAGSRDSVESFDQIIKS